ncbi:MAG: biliverdin-producing heme oxygenase [Pseudomonadota bacterium]
MPLSTDSALHRRLRQATTNCHRELDRQPLLSRLRDSNVTLVQYGNALAALHGIYLRSEAAILAYLQADPSLFDYQSRRKVPALESDLSSLGRSPVPLNTAGPELNSVGALVGTLYTLEGSMLGGQFIARTLPPRFPRHFYTVYGEQTGRRWEEFLMFADAACPTSAYETAATTAIALFASLKQQLDDAQRCFEQG